MSFLLAEVIDVEALGDTALAAFVGGVVVTFAFSLAILGTTKASELRADGRGVAAALAMTMGVIALAVSVGAVGIGLVVMVSD